MTTPHRILTLSVLLSNDITYEVLVRMRADLNIKNNPRIKLGYERYEELCLGCLTSTNYGSSFDMQTGCNNCNHTNTMYKLFLLSQHLGLEVEGPDRRLLFQWCYQCLSLINSKSNLMI